MKVIKKETNPTTKSLNNNWYVDMTFDDYNVGDLYFAIPFELKMKANDFLKDIGIEFYISLNFEDIPTEYQAEFKLRFL